MSVRDYHRFVWMAYALDGGRREKIEIVAATSATEARRTSTELSNS